MRTLTLDQIQDATGRDSEIESITIHATGIIIKGVEGDETVERDVRAWLLEEIDCMPLKMRQDLFAKTMDKELHTC